MNGSELNENKLASSDGEEIASSQPTDFSRSEPPAVPVEALAEEPSVAEPEPASQEMPAEPEAKPGLGRNKMILLSCGLAAAIVFFAFTLLLGRSHHGKAGASPHSLQHAQQQTTGRPEGAIAPIMAPLRKPDAAASNDGQLTVEDIERMRSPDGSKSIAPPKSGSVSASTSQPNGSLASIPAFSDTQQKWEEPRHYGEETNNKPSGVQQEQALLKETSIVFVRTQTTASESATSTSSAPGSDEPFLDVTPGSRILAKLRTEISTADATLVVAQVEYTYAIGDEVVLPAGAQIYGHVQQADRAGNVSVKFEEVELLDHRKERIEAVGKGLDMGPIRGKVYGKNTGKNLLVRSVSGLGSTMAMVFGTNTSSAFSEDDMIRERLAENIGTAGDSEIMNMALNSREFVEVPAETRIYVVFTKQEESPSTLHKVTP